MTIKEHDVKTLNEVYTYLADKLNQHHEEWRQDNWKLRGLELAMRQVHGEGDISTQYALDVLKEEYDRLLAYNNKDDAKLYAEKEFLHEFERYSNEHYGIELNETHTIFGY